MDNNTLFVTKKELYSVAVNISGMVAFAGGFLGNKGYIGVYAMFWAVGLMLYYLYKLHVVKNSSTISESKPN